MTELEYEKCKDSCGFYGERLPVQNLSISHIFIVIKVLEQTERVLERQVKSVRAHNRPDTNRGEHHAGCKVNA